MYDPFQTALDEMQNELIETMLSTAEQLHAEDMAMPLPGVEFMRIVRRQLVNDYDFDDDYASRIVLNSDIPPPPVELSTAHIERSAAIVSAKINRLYMALVDAGFSGGEELCAYVGKRV